MRRAKGFATTLSTSIGSRRSQRSRATRTTAPPPPGAGRAAAVAAVPVPVVSAAPGLSEQAPSASHSVPESRAGRRGQRLEREYERMGALCYLAAWDARRARIFDRCAPKDGIEPFDALVDQLMSQHPYRSAQRVFLIVDNGSAHRGKRSIERLQGAWPNLVVVHTPVHASWLNQAEIDFSVIQRRVVTPNDFADLDTLEQHLLAFGRRYEQIAAPFQWKFTRRDLHELLAKTDSAQRTPLAA